ncbi:outer membrane beta-barrel protein, partial [Akkermansiaceae bacterium]|nr:outer membrane beta-barrel protein [Akkermansiaceae bacterium]
AGQLGYVHYFDDLDYSDGLGGIVSVDQSTPTGNLLLNWTHRISERLRLSSRNSVGFEYQPDYSIGASAARQVGAYYRWSSDNAVGYRWTERLATYTGVIFDGISYDEDDFSNNDVSNITFYNDFRYQLSQQTVATLTYRYSDRDVKGGYGDTQNHFLLAGLEHRFSPNSVGIIRAGVQIRDIDGVSDSSTTPSFEAALTTQVNSQLSVRAYARYSVEDYARAVGDSVYANTETLRIGFTGTYSVSQALSLNAGVNYQALAYQDIQTGTLGEIDEDLINAFVGFDLQVAENIYLNGSYNFEDLGSDLNTREYDRNRYSLGVRATF